MAGDQTPPKKIWKLIFDLTDCFHESCRNVHTPEEIKKFHNMPISQITLIRKVRKMTWNEPEGIRLKQLAQELNISAAAASEQVDILVRKGLLVRRPCRTDRRAICLTLSEETKNKFFRVEKFLDLKTEEFFKAITPDEAALLSTLLEKFINQMAILKARTNHESQS